MMNGLWRDLRYGGLSFIKKPVFTLAALASLILGIGVNTALFTLLSALFLRPLPVEDPARLVGVFQTLRNDAGEFVGERRLSYPNYLDYREGNQAFADLALVHMWKVNLSGGPEPLRAMAAFVTANYFKTLGLRPDQGHFFAPEDDEPGNAPTTAVLSHGCWSRVFGSDPDVVGSQILVNGDSLTVVGVAPAGFHGTLLDFSTDVFLPIRSFERISPFGTYFEVRSVGIFDAFARLAGTATLAGANAEMKALAQGLARQYPKELEGYGTKVKPLLESTFVAADRERYGGYTRTLVAAVVILLAIACLNVSTLLFVRGMERARELAVRAALGASRQRLMRQLMTENVLLCGVGAALSLPAASTCLKLLWLFRPPQVSDNAIDLSLDLWVLGFTATMALGVAFVFGLVPAFLSSQGDLVGGLKETQMAARRTALVLSPRHLAVVAQVALTLVALIGAGLFARTLGQSMAIDLGFAADRLMVASVAPGEQGYDETRSRDYYRHLLERAGSIPGAESAALSENRLLRGAVVQRQIFLAGSDTAAEIGTRLTHRTNVVAPGFFKTVGIPHIAGRDFTDDEDPQGLRVAIINQTMAAKAWPGQSAIGQQFHFDYPEEPPIEVVGVVADARYRELREEKQFFIYLPLAQSSPAGMTLHVRMGRDPAPFVGMMRQEIQKLDPNLPLADVATLSDFVGEALWLERVSAALLGFFGALALTLSVVGVYGLLASTVSYRKREYGICMALGAQRRDVMLAVLGKAAKLVAVGLALGLALTVTIVLKSSIKDQLYDVNPTDPATYAACSLLLFAVSLLGCWLPAWRAASTDPVTTLRVE
jgi:predicted permease